MSLKTKLNLGSAMPPIHPQHLEVMKDFENWQLVDLFVKHPDILNMDAKTLDQVPDGYLEHIYASHLLEHIEHTQLVPILETWYKKLKPGGLLTVNVPDMEWTAKQILKFESGQLLTGLYTDFEGNHGLQTIVYGSQAHEGEYHKACFTRTSLMELVDGVGFIKIKVEKIFEAHDMGCLLLRCVKPNE